MKHDEPSNPLNIRVLGPDR